MDKGEETKEKGVDGEEALLPRADPITFEDDSSETSGIPIDRGWAWMTVLGCFGIHVFAVGGVKSLGVLIVEICDRFEGVSAKEIGLVQGIISTLMMGLGLFSNLLSLRFSCRTVVVLGGLLASFGFVITAFINRFWMVYLTYSLSVGLGFGLSYIPSIVFVGSHFKKRRSLANGLSLSGSGVGSFALPNLMRVMLKEYGLPGCCMLMGALMLHVCICGLLFRPHANYRKRPRNSSIKTAINVVTKLPSIGRMDLPNKVKSHELNKQYNAANIEESGRCCKDCQETGEFEILLRDYRDVGKQSSGSGRPNANCIDNMYDSQQSVGNSICENNSSERTEKASRPTLSRENIQQNITFDSPSPRSERRSIFEWSLLTNPVFFLFFLFALFVNFCYPNIFFMLSLHAENEGEDRDSSALLMSFIGLSDLIGRLLTGWLMDFRFIDRRYPLIAYAFMSGTLSMLMPVFKSFGGLAVYAIFYGFCAGSYITLLPVVLSDLLGSEKLASSFGMVSVAYSIPLIPSPLICGQIRDSTGSWIPSFLFVGTCAAIGSLFPLLQPCLKKNQRVPDVNMEDTISDAKKIQKQDTLTYRETKK
ncbi:monocarboxylate transporter [Elysia marginata]|uniref:Monocarboxylate transporter n=1 Tax=Elysia marginata TaxID=1093978 RepID=A0AAV4J8T7_9GAST|nr:monocarboxylate transporter [Elysia marginata]